MATLCAGLLVRALWPAWGLFPGTILAGLAIAMLNVLLSSLVKRRFPATLELTLWSVIPIIAVGIWLGVISAAVIPGFG